jgi:hypothetical protein
MHNGFRTKAHQVEPWSLGLAANGIQELNRAPAEYLAAGDRDMPMLSTDSKVSPRIS